VPSSKLIEVFLGAHLGGRIGGGGGHPLFPAADSRRLTLAYADVTSAKQ